MTTQEELTRWIAPCGLVCYTCTTFADGPVVQHSRALQRWLQGFAPMAKVFSAFHPVLAEYPAFERVLANLAAGGCQGCRSGGCPMPDCHVGPCAKERGLAWCWQCPDFPCAEADFDEQLKEVWLRANARMREIGAEAYWHEVKERPHYGG